MCIRDILYTVPRFFFFSIPSRHVKIPLICISQTKWGIPRLFDIFFQFLWYVFWCYYRKFNILYLFCIFLFNTAPSQCQNKKDVYKRQPL